MKKRHFLLGTLATAGAAGALGVGWTLLPPRQRLRGSVPLPAEPGQAALNGWVKVGADDSVTVLMPRSEMGQGAHTGLAMVLADELDADWSRVRIEAAPIDAIYNSVALVADGMPFRPDDDSALKHIAQRIVAKGMREVGSMVTGGSSSIKDLWLPMRQAGASARAMLVAAAAQAWGVPAAEVLAAGGVLRHAASGRSARFGDMATAAAQQALPDAVVLKRPAQFTLIGQPLPRIDSAAKVGARAAFGLDVLLPGMRYASVRMCPTLGGSVAAFDGAAAMRMPGVLKVLSVPGFHGGSGAVAVIADTPWHALQAIDQVLVTWDEAVPAAGFDSAAAIDRMAHDLQAEAGINSGFDTGFTYHRRGDAQAALQHAASTLTAAYSAPFLAHATMEPQNCTVQFKDGRAGVWAPTQVPGFARMAAARALGIGSDAVQMNVQQLGGGFGRRLEVDFIAQAAAIARHADGAPVQTFWSRGQDTQHDFYRPPCVARLSAGLDAQGRLTAWHALSAGPSVTQQALPRLFGLPASLPTGPDKTTAEGAFDQPYELINARVAHQVVGVPVPVGYWRSVGHSHHAFFTECFIDEVAAAAAQDAVAFRAGLLQRKPRHLHVLRRAAQMAGWGRAPAPAPDGAPTALGIALHESFGSIVAQVAQVSLGPEQGTQGQAAERSIRVHRVWCVVDCGTAVNPNLVRQQMEGGIVFGLSAALHGRIDIVQGRVQQGNFHQQRILGMDTCPAIDTEVVASGAPPEGVGEPGVPPIAPAVANALFALTGQRQRNLPLQVRGPGLASPVKAA